jgi:hypothetical protein
MIVGGVLLVIDVMFDVVFGVNPVRLACASVNKSKIQSRRILRPWNVANTIIVRVNLHSQDDEC